MNSNLIHRYFKLLDLNIRKELYYKTIILLIMKTIIYFFSGTGNSLKVAKDLAKNLGNAELIPIAKVWQQENIIPTAEKVGFVFPLYFAGVPAIVHNFLDRIKLNNVNYIFAVITSHGGGSGATLYQINKKLKIKSKSLSAGFSIEMPGNYIPMYDITSEEEQKLVFEKSKERISHITEIIKDNKFEIKRETVPFIGNIISNYFSKKFSEKDKKFITDEKCNSCGVCETVCPVNNIKIVDGKPQWQHKCQQCLACIHFCPTFAIQYGNKTMKRKRYHHPEITLKDIINQK
jgi:ferredoxin